MYALHTEGPGARLEGKLERRGRRTSLSHRRQLEKVADEDELQPSERPWIGADCACDALERQPEAIQGNPRQSEDALFLTCACDALE
jgi:hypothetical protein